MLDFILIILKVIGITLAVLVGLILLIVLLLLLVPFRYQGEAAYPVEGENDPEAKGRANRSRLKSRVLAGQEITEGQEEEKTGIPLKAHGRVTWLLHALNISLDYDNTGNIVIVKLFGIKLVSTLPEDLKKKEEKARKKREKRRKKQEKQREKRRRKKEKQKAKRKKAAEKRKKAATKTQNRGDALNKDLKGQKPKTEESAGTKPEIKEEVKTEAKTEVKTEAKSEAKTEAKTEAKSEAKSEAKKEAKKEAGPEAKNETEPGIRYGDESWEENGPEKKSIVEKIKSIYNKAGGFFEKLQTYRSFSEDFRVRKALKYIWKKAVTVLKRVLPKTLQGYIEYGFDNPANTGYVSALAAMFAGRWDGHVEIKPDFEKKVLKTDIKLKGKIRLAGVGIPALKVWLNKDVKYLRTEFDNLKKGKYSPPDKRENASDDKGKKN